MSLALNADLIGIEFFELVACKDVILIECINTYVEAMF
jgi:hypothetical protein